MNPKFLKRIKVFLFLTGITFWLVSEWSSRTRIRVLEDEIVLRCINILSVLEKRSTVGDTQFFRTHGSLVSGSINSLNKIKDSHPGSQFIMHEFKNVALDQNVLLDPDIQ